MKLTLRLFFVLSVIFTLSTQVSTAQISIQSSKGYSVNIYVAPIGLIIYGNDNKCTWGYNYDLDLEFTVTITGKNAPKSLYTLQGTINSNNASLFFQLPKKQSSGTTKTNSHAWRSVSDCATASVATMNFKTIDIAISGEGINYQVVSFAYSQILPVKMVSFTTKEDGKKVKLNWQTATETDNDFFTVERSTNQNDWSAVKKIKGAGNSTELRGYEATDEFPVTGTSYYRIKQTDLNGNATYSETRSVKLELNSIKLSVFPVPNSGNTITVNGITEYRSHELSVINAAGLTIFITNLSNATVELPVLLKGIYFIQIKDKTSGKATTLRYVKI